MCPLRSQLGKPLSRNGVRRPDADPIRKARFRESARAIVAKDRHDRKYGLPVDTAGAVARAMEKRLLDDGRTRDLEFRAKTGAQPRFTRLVG